MWKLVYVKFTDSLKALICFTTGTNELQDFVNLPYLHRAHILNSFLRQSSVCTALSGVTFVFVVEVWVYTLCTVIIQHLIPRPFLSEQDSVNLRNTIVQMRRI